MRSVRMRMMRCMRHEVYEEHGEKPCICMRRTLWVEGHEQDVHEEECMFWSMQSMMWSKSAMWSMCGA